MLDRRTIEERLADVPRDFAVAFALRAAMRGLPMIANNTDGSDPFWFWRKHGARHAFSVMHILRITYISLIKKQDPNQYGFAANAHDAYVAASITAVAGRAIYACAYAAKDVIAAIRAVAVIANDSLQKILLNDLDSIKSEDDVLGYLQKPLWLNELPNNWLNDWVYFKQSILELDAGFAGSLDWFDERIAGEAIDLGLLQKQVLLPEEILAQDVASINAYLNTLHHADKPLNRVRAIFMGHGTAGKTSLVRCLRDEDVVEGKEDMTPGIDIREWPLPDSEIRAHLWDFGGQVIAHATHQFFLRSGCLYVLVMDSRAEINANEQAQYWLEHVKAFAGAAPVILVGNKADKVRINLDMDSLTERYPNIVDFYNLSCTQYKTDYKSDFDRFRRDFIQQLKQLDLHQVKFLDAHFNAMEALRVQSSEQAFLSQAEFNQYCQQSGVQKDGGLNQDWLLDTLDKLGVIIHFPDMPFHDAYVLNPRWLTYGVYTLLYSEEAKKNQGRLSKKQVIAILQEEEIQDEQKHFLPYPADKCGFIIEAMRSFKLCYFLKDDPDTLVIPDLLPASRPTLDFDKDQPGVVFEFRFPHLLPRHVMPMFIVFRHDEIEDGQVWQTGVVLKNQTHAARAMVTANYSDRVITLNVQGSGAKDYLHILHDEIIQIVRKLKELPYEEWVEVTELAMIDRPLLLGRSKEKVSYRQLLNMLKDDQVRYVSSSGFKYNLSKILGGIMTSKALKKETGDSYIFNNDGDVVLNKGHMENVAFSGDVNITQLSADLNAELRKLIDEIKVEVGDSADRNKALRELELVRGQITQAVDGDQLEKQDAKAGLKDFAEKFKNGVGYVAQVTKDLAVINDKLPGLVLRVGSFVDKLPF